MWYIQFLKLGKHLILDNMTDDISLVVTTSTWGLGGLNRLPRWAKEIKMVRFGGCNMV